MSSRGLPHSLLDLTYAWTRTHRPVFTAALVRNGTNGRPLQTHALLQRPLTQPQLYGGKRDRALRTRDRPTTQIGRQVKPRLNPIQSLKQRVDALLEQPLDEHGTLQGPLYTEDDLQSVYADLLAHSIPPTPSPAAIQDKSKPTDVDHATFLQNAMLRFGTGIIEQSAVAPRTSTLSDILRNSRQEEDCVDVATSQSPTDYSLTADFPQHTKLLKWLQEAVENVESSRDAVKGSLKAMTEQTADFPVKLLSLDEWKALMHACLEHSDVATCELALDLAQRNDPAAFSSILDLAVETAAERGDVSVTENFIDKFTGGKPSEHYRDLHIKAHLKAPIVNPDEDAVSNITRALSTLHSYEALSLAPQQRTYARLVTALFRAHSAHCHAQAWDLFAHMRYVAHPKPDELMYALMIRACAGAGASQGARLTEPERALDLWKELTVDGRTPGVGAYNAIILACGRSKKYASEAFRLVKEMLDAHRDAFGTPLMQPDGDTFCALLEAAKKTGDLARARWMLAEMINVGKRIINEEAMMHIFHTYTTYSPPFQRAATKLVLNELTKSSTEAVEEGDTARDIEVANSKLFTAIPPQTHAEVIAEAVLLFERIMDNNSHFPPTLNSVNSELTSDAFAGVAITSRLVNSYLSVFYAHSTLPKAQALFKRIFTETGVEKTARTYLEALEFIAKVAKAHNEDDRSVALSFADELWAEWVEIEKSLPKYGHAARTIERVYVAMIRLTARFDDIERSVSIVRSFFNAYDPRSVQNPAPIPLMRSTRTQLYAHKPIIRLTTPTDVPDDKVPPLLTFSDVRVLHQRLVQTGRERDIGFLKYVCVSFECGLKKRRERSMKLL